MGYRGRVKNGAIVLDDPLALPEDTEVLVEPVKHDDGPNQTRTLYERFERFIGVVDDLPPDMAEQHDHYIHGTPRT